MILKKHLSTLLLNSWTKFEVPQVVQAVELIEVGCKVYRFDELNRGRINEVMADGELCPVSLQ